MAATQYTLFENREPVVLQPTTRIKQLLKWIGNKQRFAQKILTLFPEKYNCYIEPFLGSGAVLGQVAPRSAIAGDILSPLVGIWKILQEDPYSLISHYKELWEKYVDNPKFIYAEALCRFNRNPNPHDLLFLCRTCYGGIVRFTRQGTMSTPIGPHRPIPPTELAERVFAWRDRVKNTKFVEADFRETMRRARKDDIVYCDPPYSYSQSILYGAQSFHLGDLWKAIEQCVASRAKVALSIDGRKKSGTIELDLDLPRGLFKRQIMIDCGHSMVRRFQKKGQQMVGERVHDRLLLTW